MPTAIRSKMVKKYLYRHALLVTVGGYVGIALILAKWFGVDILPPCLWKAVFGHNCPGCGLTRAMLSLMSLDFKAAFHFNPLIFILLPGAAIYIVNDVKKFKRNFKADPKKRLSSV